MSGKFHPRVLFIFLFWQCLVSCSHTMYSGSWCPYHVEKTIPCRVRNGTEPYYGPKICWKNINGSYACTKKILHRPKFSIKYKTIFETKYKCCPGFEGSDCQNECFNCTSYQSLIKRVTNMELRFNHFVDVSTKLEENALQKPNVFVEEGVLHGNFLHEGNNDMEKSLTFITLNTRISSLISEFRNMESRIRTLEAEVFRLSTDLELDSGESSQFTKDLKISKESTTSALTRFEGKESIPTSLIPPKQSASNLETPVKSGVSANTSNLSLTFARHLETNLERGDIASTLNDDYGEEGVFENSTEQYIDPLSKGFFR